MNLPPFRPPSCRSVAAAGTPHPLPAGEVLPAHARRNPRAAFTLIEIMVAMLLLSVIVIGLVAMFGQTQSAFRIGMAQSDITEAGRSVMNLVARELMEAAPSRMNASNFIIYNDPALPPLRQEITGSTPVNPRVRTNVLQTIFFLTRQNKQWSLVGYGFGLAPDGFGTLYRFETNLPAALLPYATQIFPGHAITNFSRVADGIVHFRLRALDTNGVVVWAPPSTNLHQQVFSGYSPNGSGEQDFWFASNAVPYALGIEIGVLPPRMVERLRALPTPGARTNYLGQAFVSGGVELYQQRITLPQADVTAYQ